MKKVFYVSIAKAFYETNDRDGEINLQVWKIFFRSVQELQTSG